MVDDLIKVILEKKVGALSLEDCQTLIDPQAGVATRCHNLFRLLQEKSEHAVDALCNIIFRHEAAYICGQMGDSRAIKTLCECLDNNSENDVVRHEAAEALGAIGAVETLDMLDKYSVAPTPEFTTSNYSDFSCDGLPNLVLTTCLVSAERIRKANPVTAANGGNDINTIFTSVDPTPAVKKGRSIAELEACLINREGRTYDRFEALFALRNINTREATQALITELGRSPVGDDPLYRHELAFVMGQMANSETADVLIKAVEDPDEHPVSRHECAVSLGSVADCSLGDDRVKCVECLKRTSKHPNPIISDSCLVGLRICDEL